MHGRLQFARLDAAGMAGGLVAGVVLTAWLGTALRSSFGESSVWSHAR